MADVLFTNARIFDGSGDLPYSGDVLVQGNRIARVTAPATARAACRCRARRRSMRPARS
jgi:N-acyl-D-aspartate/D-glutamate deacylase